MTYRLGSSFLLSAFLLVACGDDEVIPDRPDAGGSDATDIDAAPPSSRAVVVAGDFTAGTGIASTIEIPALTVDSNVVAGVVSSDPVVKAFGDRVIVINRFNADNIVVLNTDDLSLVEQVSTGAGSNPQDAARVNGKIYVATYAGVGVSIIDESDLAGGVASTIDLSANDPDNEPNCASIVSAGDFLFVSCQLLDSGTFLPRGPGIVVVIDPSDDTVVDTLTLANNNPFSYLVATPAGGAFGGDILVSTVPDFASYSAGCIERISTGATPTVGACLITNATLGGYVSDLVVNGAELFATVTTCPGGDCFGGPTISAIARIDSDGALAGKLTTTSSHPTDIAVCPTGELVVGDTDYADSPGVRVYAADATELTSSPLDVGLPPAFTNAITCY